MKNFKMTFVSPFFDSVLTSFSSLLSILIFTPTLKMSSGRNNSTASIDQDLEQRLAKLKETGAATR